MRTVVWLTPLLLQASALAAEPAPAPPSSKLKCESRDLGYNSKEITCPLPASAGRQRFRLTINFSGGHDDTNAGMNAFLDNEALACDAGSKTRLFGEDGDVCLTCVFSVAASQALAPRVVKANVVWSHADYTGYSLVEE